MSDNSDFRKKILQERFSNIFEEKLLNEIAENGLYASYDRGDILVDIGYKLTHIPLIINGLVKVLREDEHEDELLLYYLEENSTCAISFVNCIEQTESMFRAIVEEDTECILIPVSKIEDWMVKYKSWREFIIDSYHNRMLEMAETIKSLAFLKLDDRISQYLKNQVKVKKTKNLIITHQEIANDLHTSRVVISRILKAMENKGKIKISRNKIKIST